MKHIKKFKELPWLIKESNKYDLGCVMIDFNFSNWNEILSLINPSDIYEGQNYGLQKRPHLTLLFGLLPEVTEGDVSSCFNGISIKDIKVEIDGISVFENDEFDVVKLNVKNNEVLSKINQRLSQLPNKSEFEEYKPHITIGYVKKGTGRKYINDKYHHIIDNITTITFSKAKGSDVKIPV